MKTRITFLISALLFAANLFAFTNREIFDISTADTSLLLSVDENGLVHTIHYGKKIIDPASFKDSQATYSNQKGEPLSTMPARGGKNTCEPAFAATLADGDLNAELRFQSFKKNRIADMEVAELTLLDRKSKLSIKIIFTAYISENVISQHTEITNLDKSTITLNSFASAHLPVVADKYFLSHSTGFWAAEMQPLEEELKHGIKTIQSRKLVRTTQTENPSFMLSLQHPLSETEGEVIAGALAWSGNYKINFEIPSFPLLHITMGILPCNIKLDAGKTFKTPEAIFTYSANGAGQASRNLHNWARKGHGIYAAEKLRPIVINSWEAAYFNFDEAALKAIIDDAADMGIEMFVLDDGWFGNKFPRNNDTMGLGDWQVNTKKLPNSIGAIADYAVSKGLGFGIWIEPEMVNAKSELAQKHPDWIIQFTGRQNYEQRNQLMLDLSNPAVQDFVFNTFDNTLKLSDKISYVKWDANRHIDTIGSLNLPADQQESLYIKYVEGLNNVYTKIREKYPNIIIQACASGGGRVDYGTLKFHNEFWASDNTDAFVRAKMQYAFSFIYPPMALAAHISASPNHQTGNSSPIKFRFDVASACRLGFELLPKNMTPQERSFVKESLKTYKKVRSISSNGDLYRLKSPFDGDDSAAFMFLSKDKKEALVFIYSLNYHSYATEKYFKLQALNPTKSYKLTPLYSNSNFWANNKILSGEFLMLKGLNPPLIRAGSSYVFLLTETDN